MAMPTIEEYEEALESKKYLDDAIRREYKRRDDLINQLCGSQKLLDGYKQSLDYQKDIIQKYEIYREIWMDSIRNM
jgi:hypothetical protein